MKISIRHLIYNKIDRGQIKFREYSIALLQPYVVYVSGRTDMEQHFNGPSETQCSGVRTYEIWTTTWVLALDWERSYSVRHKDDDWKLNLKWVLEIEWRLNGLRKELSIGLTVVPGIILHTYIFISSLLSVEKNENLPF